MGAAELREMNLIVVNFHQMARALNSRGGASPSRDAGAWIDRLAELVAKLLAGEKN